MYTTTYRSKDGHTQIAFSKTKEKKTNEHKPRRQRPRRSRYPNDEGQGPITMEANESMTKNAKELEAKELIN